MYISGAHHICNELDISDELITYQACLILPDLIHEWSHPKTNQCTYTSYGTFQKMEMSIHIILQNMIIFYLSHLLNHQNTLMIHFITLAYFWMKSSSGYIHLSSTKLHMWLKNGDVISQFLLNIMHNFLFESFVESSQNICQLIKCKFLPLNV